MDMRGEVLVIGTPAEEEGGGKVKLIEHGVFDECDVCLIAHPSYYELLDPVMLAVSQFTITYHGM